MERRLIGPQLCVFFLSEPRRRRLLPPQLPLRHLALPRRHQIPQTIRRIIAANTILIGIHLQHILRPIRIVLQRRKLKPR